MSNAFQNGGALDAQRQHWQATFLSMPEMFGLEASYAAQQAAEAFRRAGKRRILELGSGQGRDTLFFLRRGFEVCAVDYSEPGLRDLLERAERAALRRRLRTVVHDVRKPLPFEAVSYEACFSHMLYCMALTTAEIEALSDEIHRVLKPDGLSFYTARSLKDPDYGTGIHRGENLYELEGGFIVHFFCREMVERLAKGYQVLSVEEFEETELPKRLYLVGLRKGGG